MERRRSKNGGLFILTKRCPFIPATQTLRSCLASYLVQSLASLSFPSEAGPKSFGTLFLVDDSGGWFLLLAARDPGRCRATLAASVQADTAAERFSCLLVGEVWLQTCVFEYQLACQ